VANWSNAWGAWVLKPYKNGIIAPEPAYYITRQGQIIQASGYPSSWSLTDLVYLHQNPR
jgi:hypothetical protein